MLTACKDITFRRVRVKSFFKNLSKYGKKQPNKRQMCSPMLMLHDAISLSWSQIHIFLMHFMSTYGIANGLTYL
jgi:hypothetical protein